MNLMNEISLAGSAGGGGGGDGQEFNSTLYEANGNLFSFLVSLKS